MESPVETSEDEALITPEGEPFRSIRDLKILIHPSFLVGNTTHPNSYKGRRERPVYEKATKDMMRNARERFLPLRDSDVLLIMPHEDPSFQSWRNSLEAKQRDPELGTWTDIYSLAKRSKPDNVFLTEDLTWPVNENWQSRVDEARQEAQRAIVDELKVKGLALTPDTDITIGGEFRNLCVYEVAKKLLYLPNVQRLKIDKATSFNSVYAYGFDEEYTKERDADHQEILIACLEDGWQVGEDDEYIYVEKSTDASFASE